jgi:uncharacterized protein (DUF4415 family)
MTQKYKKPLTPDEIAKLQDSEIDFSDIPELDAAFLKNMELKEPQVKPTVSVKLPPHVLEFYVGEDRKGYTSRMAAVLTAYAEAHQQK